MASDAQAPAANPPPDRARARPDALYRPPTRSPRPGAAGRRTRSIDHPRERRRRSTDHATRRPARHPPNRNPPASHERDPRTVGRPRRRATPPDRPQPTRPADPHAPAGRDRERSSHRPDRVRDVAELPTPQPDHGPLANAIDPVPEHPCTGRERDQRPVPPKRRSRRNTEPAVLTDPIGPHQPDRRPRKKDRTPIRRELRPTRMTAHRHLHANPTLATPVATDQHDPITVQRPHREHPVTARERSTRGRNDAQ